MEFIFTVGLVFIAYLLTVNQKQARQIKNIEKRIDQLFIAHGKKQAQEKKEGEAGK